LGLYSRKVEKNYKTDYFRFLKQELLKEKRFYILLIIQNLKLIRIKTHYAQRSGCRHMMTNLQIYQIKEKSNQTMTEKNFQIQQIKNKMLLIMLILWKTELLLR
jgi:hypothetical protein